MSFDHSGLRPKLIGFTKSQETIIIGALNYAARRIENCTQCLECDKGRLEGYCLTEAERNMVVYYLDNVEVRTDGRVSDVTKPHACAYHYSMTMWIRLNMFDNPKRACGNCSFAAVMAHEATHEIDESEAKPNWVTNVCFDCGFLKGVK